MSVQVELSQDLRSRGCKRGEKSNLRLVELGPRLHLQLLKIEEQIDDGQVLYHSYINKSPAELARQHEASEIPGYHLAIARCRS